MSVRTDQSGQIVSASSRGPPQASREVEAIQIHDLIPRRDEIVDEFLSGVGAAVHLGQSAQLGMGAEDQIDSRGGPLDGASGAVAAFEEVGVAGGRLPLDGLSRKLTKKSLVVFGL